MRRIKLPLPTPSLLFIYSVLLCLFTLSPLFPPATAVASVSAAERAETGLTGDETASTLSATEAPASAVMMRGAAHERSGAPIPAYNPAAAAEELQQVRVSGRVVDRMSGLPLAGVNVTVRGRYIGTSTGSDGAFSLSVTGRPPLTLLFSLVGYRSEEIEITADRDDLQVSLQEQAILGSDVVVSASRFEQSFLEAPVTIETMDIISITESPSDNYYRAIGNLKGIDMTSSSINFQIINARGFNSTGNTRMVQLIDGMDTQAPALNFPIGNLNGPTELDIESIEFLPGASSALYGPNAFNGVLLINSKSPFLYPGLSVKMQAGMNHLGGDTAFGEPDNVQPMYDMAVRYADTVGDRFGYKFNAAWSRAEDWHGINFSDKNRAFDYPGNPDVNPAYDGVHLYGDDGSFNIGLLGINPDTRSAIATQMMQQFGISRPNAEAYVASLPGQPVNRTGYRESYLVDYDAENLRLNSSLHYRLTENAELSYTINYGSGTSVYTGAQRYSLNNFHILQNKLELRGDNYMVRGYGTFESSGDSYIADFVGFAINEAHRPSAPDLAAGEPGWYGTYGAAFASRMILAATVEQGGNTSFNPATVQALLSDPQILAQFHTAAREAADAGRFEAGSPQFEAAKQAALQATIPNGALFDDRSRFYHADGIYDFKNEIDVVDLQVGASFRQFQLRSNGTIFDDLGGRNINEFGGFVQASRELVPDFRLTGSIRYDKNENFDGQFSPRLAAVLGLGQSHNLRGSFQTGFRNPSTQGQYIDLNVITARLIGGLPFLAERYQITDNAWTMDSVENFTNQFLSDPTDPASAAALLRPYAEHRPVSPEQIQSFEIGYKGLIDDRLLIDAAYYYNIFDDFITQIRVRRAAAPINTQQGLASLLSGSAANTFQVYTNIDETVRAHGAVFGLDYSLPANYRIGVNYNWNRLITSLDERFTNTFNTPEHKVNVTFGNRRLTDNLGFNLVWRWQDAFRWETSFVRADVDAVSTLDAQISYHLPQMNSVVRLGGSNILNQSFTMNGGGPRQGAIVYLSITYDQVFNR